MVVTHIRANCDAIDNINVSLYHMQTNGPDFCLFMFYAVREREKSLLQDSHQ